MQKYLYFESLPDRSFNNYAIRFPYENFASEVRQNYLKKSLHREASQEDPHLLREKLPPPPLANELRRSGIRLNVDIEMRRRGAYEARTRGNLAPEVLPTEKVRRLLR